MTETTAIEKPKAGAAPAEAPKKARKPRKVEPKRTIVFAVGDDGAYSAKGEAKGVREAMADLQAGKYGAGRFHVGAFKGNPFVLKQAAGFTIVKPGK